MKTTISIPNNIFNAAERLAKKLGISRSNLENGGFNLDI